MYPSIQCSGPHPSLEKAWAFWSPFSHRREPGPTASAAPSPLSASRASNLPVYQLKVTGDLLVGSGDTGLVVAVPLGWLLFIFLQLNFPEESVC